MAAGRSGVVAGACASFAVLGAGITLPGALLPTLLDAFHASLVEAGSMLACMPVAQVVATLAAVPLLARVRADRVAALGVALLAGGLGTVPLATGWVSGAACLAVAGLGVGLIEVAVNTLLVSDHGPHTMNVLNFAHLFFGVGCVVTPLLATQAVARGVAWPTVFVACAAVTAAVAAAWPALGGADAAAPSEVAGVRGLGAGAWLLAACMALYVGTELGTSNWLSEYMVRVRGVGLADAGGTIALYWFGLTAGRVVLTAVGHRIRDVVLVPALAAVATGALAAALVAPHAPAASAAIVVMGLGLSGIFPGLMAIAGRWHPHARAAATGLLVLGAGAGGIVVPWGMSAVADVAGVGAAMWCYVATAGAMAALATAARSRGGA